MQRRGNRGGRGGVRMNVGKIGIGKWLPLAVGLFCGASFVWFFQEKLLQDELFFGAQLFENGMHMEYSSISYLGYLLKIRGIQVAFIILMACFNRKRMGLFLWAWMTGCGFGIGIFMMIKRWGPVGIIGYLFLILPHYLLYFYGYSEWQKNDCLGQQGGRRGNLNGGTLRRNIAFLGVVIIGILMECYVNPFFVKIFSNLFL